MTVSANQTANSIIQSIEAPLAKTVHPATATRMPAASVGCPGEEKSALAGLLNGVSPSVRLRHCTLSLRNWPRRRDYCYRVTLPDASGTRVIFEEVRYQ